MRSRILNSLLIAFALSHGLPNVLSAEALPTIPKLEKERRIPDGFYLIPSSIQNGGAETSVQILDGDVCFVSVTGVTDSLPYEVNVFVRDGIEVLNIRKGDTRSMFISRAGQPVTPKKLSPEQAQELRAIGLSMKLMVNTLNMNPTQYRKNQTEQVGAGQSDTSHEPTTENSDKPQTEAECRSR